MSFNHFARKVYNPNLPTGIRRSALASCIGSLGWLTKQSHHKLHAYFKIDFHSEMTDIELFEIITSVEIVRKQYLERLHNFERTRIREKMQGRRQPRQKDIKKLYNWETYYTTRTNETEK